MLHLQPVIRSEALGRRSMTQQPRALGIQRSGQQKLPANIRPMLPIPAREPFDSDQHVFELDWDGLRAFLFHEDGQVRVQDAYGRDSSCRFPEIAGLGSRLRTDGLVLDGEIVALDSAGRPDFQALQRRLLASLPEAGALAQARPLTYHAFDVLYSEGRSLMQMPLWQRKAALHKLLRPSDRLWPAEFVENEGVAFFEAARDHGLAGIMAREKAASYLPGVGHANWQSLRIYQRREFVVCGYTFGGPSPEGRRAARQPFASLLLGLFDDKSRLSFAGEVAGGFTPESFAEAQAWLEPETSMVQPVTSA